MFEKFPQQAMKAETEHIFNLPYTIFNTFLRAYNNCITKE